MGFLVLVLVWLPLTRQRLDMPTRPATTTPNNFATCHSILECFAAVAACENSRVDVPQWMRGKPLIREPKFIMWHAINSLPKLPSEGAKIITPFK